ncbi:MAG: hypothetical protein ACJ784_00165 [Myxococcales bacterium]
MKVKEQRVVVLYGITSYLLMGDPDRMKHGTPGDTHGEAAGEALPTLLAAGWRVLSVTAVGEGRAFILLERYPP